MEKWSEGWSGSKNFLNLKCLVKQRKPEADGRDLVITAVTGSLLSQRLLMGLLWLKMLMMIMVSMVYMVRILRMMRKMRMSRMVILLKRGKDYKD